MATHLDLEEQEQLDQLKAFWKRWGNLITWVIDLALAAYAAWNGWNWYERRQAVKAAAMYDELSAPRDAAMRPNQPASGNDLRSRFAGQAPPSPRPACWRPSCNSKGQGRCRSAKPELGGSPTSRQRTEYRAVARLRLAGVLMDQKLDEALKSRRERQGFPGAGGRPPRRRSWPAPEQTPRRAAFHKKAWTGRWTRTYRRR